MNHIILETIHTEKKKSVRHKNVEKNLCENF